MEVREIFAKKAKARMEVLGITQTELAKSLKTDQGAISAYINAKRNPQLDTVTKWAEALGVTVGWLLSEDDAAIYIAREPSPAELLEAISSKMLEEGKLLTALTILLRNASRESVLDVALAALSPFAHQGPNQTEHKASVG
jgi:transcriptional regulator with XRE-family HTH domain